MKHLISVSSGAASNGSLKKGGENPEEEFKIEGYVDESDDEEIKEDLLDRDEEIGFDMFAYRHPDLEHLTP